MLTTNTRYMTINERRVKVQRWRQQEDCIALTVLVHGDNAGTNLYEELQSSTVTLAWDGADAVVARPVVTGHRVVGQGPTSVHRIEVAFWMPDDEKSVETLTIDEKLDRILHQLSSVRTALEEMRTQLSGNAAHDSTTYPSGQTLLDFEIDTETTDDPD